jgi:hypothetical protein
MGIVASPTNAIVEPKHEGNAGYLREAIESSPNERGIRKAASPRIALAGVPLRLVVSVPRRLCCSCLGAIRML